MVVFSSQNLILTFTVYGSLQYPAKAVRYDGMNRCHENVTCKDSKLSSFQISIPIWQMKVDYSSHFVILACLRASKRLQWCLFPVASTEVQGSQQICSEAGNHVYHFGYAVSGHFWYWCRGDADIHQIRTWAPDALRILVMPSGMIA